MKAILTIIIVLLLAACQPVVENVSPDTTDYTDPMVDDTQTEEPADTTPEPEETDTTETEETDTPDPDETDLVDLEEEVDEPLDVNETEETDSTVDLIDPQMDPKAVVDEYLKQVTLALDEDDQDAWEAAYALVSPHSKKNVPWVASLSRYKGEADNTYEKFFTGNNVTGYTSREEFGIGYKIYYTYEEGEVYYIVQYIDDLYWVAQGSQRGSMFWRYYP